MFSGKRLKIKMLEFSSIIFLIPIVAVIYTRIAVEKYQFIGGGSVLKDGNRSNLDFDTASFFDVGRRDDTQHGGKSRENSKKSMFQMFL